MRMELSIAPDYVQWGLWECLRELLQNGQDANDIGHKMKILYREKFKELTIENVGATMGRDALVLGRSSKRGDSRQRGQFGEGFKLAWASLLRLGLEVSMRVDDELWTPTLEHSEAFETVVLVVTTSKRTAYSGIKVKVLGIEPAVWEQVQDRLLFLRPPTENFIRIDKNTILTDPERKGQLFARGIYVGQLAGNYRYGYDLADVSLDRDRRVVDEWTLRESLKRTLKAGVNSGQITPEEMMEILAEQCRESDAFNDDYDFSQATLDVSKKLKEAFEIKFGADAVPVSSMGDSVEAKHHGLKGIVVQKSLVAAIEKSMGSIMGRMTLNATTVSRRYGVHELDEGEIAMMEWIVGLVSQAEPWFTLDSFNVVEFTGNKVVASYDPNTEMVSVRRADLSNREELMISIVHEVAHRYGGDGTHEHQEGRDHIWCRMLMAQTLS